MAPASSTAYIMEDPREGSRLAQKIDPDVWVVEIEDRNGRDFLVEDVERG